MTFEDGPPDRFDDLFAEEEARRARARPARRFPLLAHLAARAEQPDASQLEVEAGYALAELEALDRRFTAARARQARQWCRWCDHHHPHPCTAPGCSCLCRSCGWSAFGPAPDGPCDGPICRQAPS